MKRLAPFFILGTLLATPVHSQPTLFIPPDMASIYQKADAEHLVLVTFTDQSINSIPDSASADFYRKRGDYQSTTWSQRLSEEIAADHHLAKLIEWPMTELGMHCVVYKIAAASSMSATLQELAQDSRLAIVQQMHYFKTQSHHYNDPYHKLQSNLLQMQVDQVHAQTTGRAVNIAMIDTGVALDHPDLVGQITDHQNFAKDISASFSNDKHGTAVAGIMVAKKDNSTGITGVAPDAKLIALKACWPDKADDIAAVCNSLTLALAVNAAIRANVDILNMSLTGPEDPLLAVLLNKAIEKGIIVVAASAGDAKPDFPASLKNVIAVQSLTHPQAANHAPVSLVTAPGDRILTTLPQGSYDFISGSSIAAAEVSGVIALLLELKADLTLAEVLTVLQKSAIPLKSGALAAINAKIAVLALCEMASCPQEVLGLAMGHAY
jgi:hypothetical protein